ncbi:MAG: formylglycine-generating enzyme family protein [Kiritimatiellae bacterium]|nr:formylglycine-generating enzyme family protein [Kiritimatiellia bacterium]
MKKAIATFAIAASAATIIRAATPTVSGTGVSESGGTLTVTYTLDAAAVVTFDATTNGAPIDASCFKSAAGDVWKRVEAGTGTFSWRPANDIPLLNLDGADLSVRVKAWDVEAPPDYMVVSLATNAATQVSVAYYECEAQLPGKVTDPVYKTSKLVMRKIPAAGVTWRMGSPSGELGRTMGSGAQETPHLVTLTADYYLGVYPVTIAQWNYMNGSKSTDMKAQRVNNMKDLRGDQSESGVAAWPGGGHTIDKASSRLYIIRQYTGIDFDIPTEAQWEFACRAGESAALYTGEELSNTASSGELDDVAWYAGNYPGTVVQWPAFMEVGLKAPNAYGLYDMLGNIYELCLDRYSATMSADAVTDPVGPTSGSDYVKRGGAISAPAYFCRAASRSMSNGSGAWADAFITSPQHCNTGWRLWAPAQAVK